MSVEELRNELDLRFGPPLSVLSECLRGFLMAQEGYDLIGADFSAIEARCVAWLAGEESILDVFRTHGQIYESEASKIYKVSMDKVTKDQRQIGKVAVLALGYGGGVGAFQSMAKNYGVKIHDLVAEQIKNAWRESNSNIVHYWHSLENAALAASISQEQKVFSAGARGRHVAYRRVGSFLWCKLPSTRVICYPYPKVELRTTPWGAQKQTLTYMTEINFNWVRSHTYGGSLCENVTQAIARDLLVDAMLRLEEKKYPVVFHVHDEVVCEIPKDFGALDEFEKIVSEVPTWAEGLPIKAQGFRCQRYHKT